jgi:valyl-tRNA synthetase
VLDRLLHLLHPIMPYITRNYGGGWTRSAVDADFLGVADF